MARSPLSFYFPPFFFSLFHLSFPLAFHRPSHPIGTGPEYTVLCCVVCVPLHAYRFHQMCNSKRIQFKCTEFLKYFDIFKKPFVFTNGMRKKMAINH